MAITLRLHLQVFTLAAPVTVAAALESLGLTPETHIALRDGQLLQPGDWLRDGDEVRLVAILSGG
jgi:sulfur carrier protein